MDEFDVVRRLGQRLDREEPDRRKADAWERIRALAEREAQPVEAPVERDDASERIRRAAELGLDSPDPWRPERGPSGPEPDDDWFGRDRGDHGIDR
jgi:hypothetical protein